MKEHYFEIDRLQIPLLIWPHVAVTVERRIQTRRLSGLAEFGFQAGQRQISERLEFVNYGVTANRMGG